MLLTLLEYAPGIFFSTIVGLGFGSYSTMAVYRLPRGERWMGLKPRCLHCGHVLVLRDFFPIFSFLWNKNECRYCGGKIEMQLIYMFVEIATVILCIWAFLLYGFSEYYLMMTAFSVTVVVIVATDIDKHFISDKALIVLLGFGLMYRGMLDDSIYNMVYGGAIAITLGMVIRHVYYRFIRKDIETAMDYTKYTTDDKFAGPGFLYIKLLAVCGIWVGASEIVIFGVVTMLFTILVMIAYKVMKQSHISYSIPLIISSLLVIFQT